MCWRILIVLFGKLRGDLLKSPVTLSVLCDNYSHSTCAAPPSNTLQVSSPWDETKCLAGVGDGTVKMIHSWRFLLADKSSPFCLSLKRHQHWTTKSKHGKVARNALQVKWTMKIVGWLSFSPPQHPIIQMIQFRMTKNSGWEQHWFWKTKWLEAANNPKPNPTSDCDNQ